ncbi:MAG: hypothetical protein P1V97_36325, partial [Planctomycetota bacterium]|nr:hypothetical protein [Planctomycetota bacterium]
MTRTHLCSALAFILMTFTPAMLLAKPMQKTPLKVGAQKATLIVIAELSRHQYEDLKDGASKEV